MTPRATLDQPADLPLGGLAEPLATGAPRRWERWLAPGFVVVAAGSSLILAALLLLVYRAIGDASLLLARGEAVQLEQAVHAALRAGPRPPQAATLEAVLARQRAHGMRYVAVLHPDGEIEVQAGEPASPLTPAVLASLGGMRLVPVGDRVRFATGPPGGDAPPGGRPGDSHAPHHPWPEPGMHGEPPPPPPRAGGGQPRLVIELEPLTSRQLTQLARRTVLAGAVAIPAFVAGAVLLGYLVKQRNELVRRLEHGRRLAALGEMSAVLAHEIRNPLASLKGHAQLLARSLDGDEAKSAKAELVVREAIRLQDLATDLLDFSRTSTIERRDADPAALLRESAGAVDAERIRIEAGGAPSSWPLDAARVRQALVNLLRNAVQASPAETPVEARVVADGDRLLFEVRDHGAGVAPDQAAHIFEPFHTSRLRGTGLGLPIARRIAEQHGGDVTVANAADGGAVFRVTIARA